MARQAPVEDAFDLTRSAWKALEDEKDRLNLPQLRVRPVAEFLEEAQAFAQNLSPADRKIILDQAAIVIEHLYPHLPFKKKVHGDVDPLRDLGLVRGQLETLRDIDFHCCMLLAFASVRDIHTAYLLPSPYRRAVAFLPFQIRFYVDDVGQRRFVVTKVMNTEGKTGFGHDSFRPGAEVIQCNEMTMESAAWSAAQLQPGANDAAGLARGVMRLTVRPLMTAGLWGHGAPPMTFQEFASITYIPVGSTEARRIVFPWGVGTGFGMSDVPASAFSTFEEQAAAACASKVLWRRDDIYEKEWVRKHYGPGGSPPAPEPTEAEQAPDLNEVSVLPEIFNFQHSGGRRREGFTDPAHLTDPANPGKQFGYIRIRSFAGDAKTLNPAEPLVREFQRILALMQGSAPHGLIVDIRSNPGGDILAAERMLQMLTPGPIQPSLFHFADTPAVADVMTRIREDSDKRFSLDENASLRIGRAITEFDAWLNSQTPEAFQEPGLSPGRPLTSINEANRIGQIYQGPVVLLTDALTFSAADVFAAGFQDHRIGPIIGMDPATGGGGANAWRHQDLLNVLPETPGLPLRELPGDAGLTLAVRRMSRVGRNAGKPVEDAGVERDIAYTRKAEDILAAGQSVLQFACEVLGQREVHRLTLSSARIKGDSVVCAIESANVDFVACFLDNRRRLEQDIQDGVHSFTIPTRGVAPLWLRIEGFRVIADGVRTRVVSARIALEAPEDVQPVRESFRVRQANRG